MQYFRWARFYEELRADLGYEWAREEESARRLLAILPEGPVAPRLAELRNAIEDRDAVVVGLAPGAGPPPVWRLPAREPAPVIVAADGAAQVCLEGRLVPTVVVTDLDGPVPSELSAQSKGATVVIHAHGDNRAAIDEWAPQFGAATIGSWAGPPGDGLIDLGGFTDGDRGAYLAEELGARRVLLWGFEWDRLAPEERDPIGKRRKLRWAERALDLLASEAPGRLFRWGRDGRVEPYPAPAGASEPVPETQ